MIGCIFWEQLEEIKAIPYFREIGALNKNADLLQQLFNRVVRAAEEKNIKAIIWVTGMDEKGHDAMERGLLERNSFRKLRKVKRWEYSPGKFSEKHWIFIKEL